MKASDHKGGAKAAAAAAARNTDSAPAGLGESSADELAARAHAVEAAAAAMPFNATKAAEYDAKAALAPPEGHHTTVEAEATGSTLSEGNASEKTGDPAEPGFNATIAPLQRVRADGSGQRLTTNQGVPVADNQNSLKAGLRGPALLKDLAHRGIVWVIPGSNSCEISSAKPSSGRRKANDSCSERVSRISC